MCKELEKALMDDKINKQCNKCKNWAEGYKTIKSQCGLFNQKCKFELKEED